MGIEDLLDEVVSIFPDQTQSDIDADSDKEICIAVAGRPNVGKSSLINKLFGEQRLMVSEQAGTTRDSVSLTIEHNGIHFKLIDTAGIRRKGKVKEKIEKFSIIKSLQSLDECDVALILIDSSEGITDQDVTIAGYAQDRGCGAIFLLNKWDIVDPDEKNQKKFIDNLRMQAKFLSFAPAMTISARTGLRTHKIFDMVESIYKEYSHRINTGLLNRIIEDAVFRSEPRFIKAKGLNFIMQLRYLLSLLQLSVLSTILMLSISPTNDIF